MRSTPASDSPWRVREADFPRGGSLEARTRFLVHYAHLAPSSHNTQPWLFRIEEDRVILRADDRRWLRIADPEQRELFVSVGCALENLLVAAEHFQLGFECRYLPDPSDPLAVASVQLREDGEPSPFRPPQLFDAILSRHTSHLPYEPRPVPAELLASWRELCVEDNIDVRFTTSADIRTRIDELVERGDAILFSDPDYRKELAHWIGEGVFGTSWVLSKIGKLAVSYLDLGRSQGKRDRELVASAPVFGVLFTRLHSSELEVRAGQVYERMSLAAAADEIWFHPMSQVLQVPALRGQIADLVAEPPGASPVMLFRAGHAEEEERHTPRRDLGEVLLSP